MSAAARPAAWPSMPPVLPAVAVALLVLAGLFTAEIGAAVHVWDTSTAYGHCWLVPPIVLWLLHERRAQAAAVRSAPAWWPVLPALLLAVLWLAADVLGIMEGRQLAVIGFVELALIAALGLRQWWALSAAALYLIFLVPFGAFLTQPLQDFTAGFVAHGLDALGIPNRVTQFQIEIPEGSFYVAEACAGLRFLIASIAFGVLYAVTMFRSPWRRAAFIAISCVVPVIANGFRGLGIVVLGHILGSAEAAATDHVLYGWIFFSIVIIALAMAGLPFREDTLLAAPMPAPPDHAAGRKALVTILPVLAAAGAGPAIAGMISAGAAPRGTAPALLLAPPGCTLTRTAADGPVLMQDFRCGAALLSARTERLPVRANPSTITQSGAAWAGTMVPGHDVDNRLLNTDGPFPMTWRLMLDEDSPHAAATVLFIDGAPALGGLHDRLTLAGHLLHGGDDSPVSVAVAVSGPVPDAREALKLFLSAQGDIVQRERVSAAERKHVLF
jgi:exosortase A